MEPYCFLLLHFHRKDLALEEGYISHQLKVYYKQIRLQRVYLMLWVLQRQKLLIKSFTHGLFHLQRSLQYQTSFNHAPTFSANEMIFYTRDRFFRVTVFSSDPFYKLSINGTIVVASHFTYTLKRFKKYKRTYRLLILFPVIARCRVDLKRLMAWFLFFACLVLTPL